MFATETDDLRLHLDLQALEGLRLAPAFLGRERSKARVGAHLVHPGVHGLSGAGQKEVDAFFRDQHRAFEVERFGSGNPARYESISSADI